MSLLVPLALMLGGEAPTRHTAVTIVGPSFHINGKPTYAGRTWRGMKLEGLLMNSRMVQGIFDDMNPETRGRWAYPDTGVWDPERNSREFVAAMPAWRKHGLLAFTINLQGGSPQGYSQAQPWHNSAIAEDGSLRPACMRRLERILDEADRLGMAAILGLFYFGQDQRLKDEAAVIRATDNAARWALDRGYRNVLIEVNNECNVRYDHAILRPERVHELIERVKSHTRNGQRLLVGTSYGGGTIPGENVVRSSDFLLMHGNGVSDPQRIAEMVRKARAVPGYRPMPILFNEDDHFDFDRPMNNMVAAVSEYASWGYFDPGKSDYSDGYQCPPVQWGINTDRKKAFFALLAEMTGSVPERTVASYPGKTWQTAAPASVGLRPEKLNELATLVQGRGCVVRHGKMVYTWGDVSRSADVASAVKPVISTLLLMAVRSGKLKSPDAAVSEVVPELRSLNGGKDGAITWRHLASQTSGYGLIEQPGTAYGYNDYALALYYDALMERVYKQDGTEVLRALIAQPIGFEDDYGFGRTGQRGGGRLRVSVRDFARFGLLCLKDGVWNGKRVLPRGLMREALGSVVPAEMPRTSGKEAAMLPDQRSLGGGKDQTPTGPGYYSFNWWVNRPGPGGKRLYVDGPPDLYAAAGHGGMRMLVVLPSLDMVVSWNDSPIDDHDASPGNPNTRCNRAIKLIVEAARG
ncbi:MAG: beta-lactamase family protein [Chthonomonadales bacterium]|nr:beta-lactamase family protein [Chthonomonadales bacterium]